MPPGFSLTLLAGCLVWVPIAIWIMTLVGWMVQGEVEFLVGLAGLCIAIGIGLVAFTSKNPQMAPFLLFASISMLVLVPVARSYKQKRDMANIDVEQIERGYELLAERPDNLGARFKIAKMLYQRGEIDQAVALADKTLVQMPKQLFEEEHRTVRSWKKVASPVPPPKLGCLKCGQSNQPGELFCAKCGAPILLQYARGHWVHPLLFRRVLLGWGAGMISIVGIPYAAMNLPPGKSAPAVFLLVITTLALGYTALKGVGKGLA